MTENPYPTERRKKKYIKPLFQSRFILQFLSFMVLGFIVFSISVYIYSQQTLTTAFINSKLRVMSTGDFLLPTLLVTALMVTVLVAIMLGIRLLLFSHKIAGPLYRLEQTANAVGSGKLNLQVRLRSGDELQDVAQSMDGMVRDLRSRTVKIKQQSDRLFEIIRQCEKIGTFPPDLLRSLRETQTELNQAVSHFQV